MSAAAKTASERFFLKKYGPFLGQRSKLPCCPDDDASDNCTQ
jgi:hypothetical protein